MPRSDEILTLKEIACLLKVQVKRIPSMDQNGELDGVRGQSRSRHLDFASWIEDQSQKVQAENEGAL